MLRVVVLGLAAANRVADPRDGIGTLPAIQEWLGVDRCQGPTWTGFHAAFQQALGQASTGDARGAMDAVVQMLRGLRGSDAHSELRTSFECATAVGSAYVVLAALYEQAGMPARALRCRQMSAILVGFDFQMKGEEWINHSVWPVQYQQSVNDLLRAKAMYQEAEARSSAWVRQKTRDAVQGASSPQQSIAIVTVCEYDKSKTPLGVLSERNKKTYAERHGYRLVFHEAAPPITDAGRVLVAKEKNWAQRPAAWSKIDALLLQMGKAEDDWVVWVDCDSFFMDFEVRLESLLGLVGAEPAADPEGDRRKVRAMANWGGPSGDATVPAFDAAFRAAFPVEEPGQRDVHWVASEDGLMLNTGFIFTRVSPWGYKTLTETRSLSLGGSPLTFHPWWEQAGMVWQLMRDSTLDSGVTQDLPVGRADMGPGFPHWSRLLTQKHVNTYPPLVGAQLLTHVHYDVGDFIIAFSGCKIFASQEVCNALVVNYFMQCRDHQPPPEAANPWVLP